MKRRIFSLLIVCTMILGVIAPSAAAFDTDPPVWQQLGYQSKDECMVAMSFEGEALTEDEYSQLASVFAEQLQRAKNYSGNYWAECGFASKQDYMNYYKLTTDEAYYRDMASCWTFQIWRDRYAEYVAQKEQQMRNQMGFTWVGVNVYVKDHYLAFDDAYPELKGGRTMVPFRAVTEALGGTVSYETTNREVLVTLNDRQVSFRIGSNTARLTSEGVTSNLPMDVTPYTQKGRTYVPVRFFAEALGYKVLWDAKYRAALVLDVDATTAQLNQNFTIINDALSKILRNGHQTYRTVADVVTKITKLDAENEASTYPVHVNMTMVADGTSLKKDMQMDITKLFDLLVEETYSIKNGDPLDEDTQKQVDLLRKALEQGDLSMIVNYDQRKVYIKSEMLVKAMSVIGMLSDGITIDGSSTWIALSLDEKDLFGENELTNLLDRTGILEDTEMNRLQSLYGSDMITVGQLLYYSAVAVANSPCEGLLSLSQSKGVAEAFLGDNALTKSGNTYTSSLDMNRTMAGDVKQALVKYLGNKGYDTLSGTVEIQSSGILSLQCVMQSQKTSVETETNVTLSHTSMDYSSVVKQKDSSEETVMKASILETSESVPTAPPSSDLILDYTKMIELPSDPSNINGQEAQKFPFV